MVGCLSVQSHPPDSLFNSLIELQNIKNNLGNKAGISSASDEPSATSAARFCHNRGQQALNGPLAGIIAQIHGSIKISMKIWQGIVQ